MTAARSRRPSSAGVTLITLSIWAILLDVCVDSHFSCTATISSHSSCRSCRNKYRLARPMPKVSSGNIPIKSNKSSQVLNIFNRLGGCPFNADCVKMRKKVRVGKQVMENFQLPTRRKPAFSAPREVNRSERKMTGKALGEIRNQRIVGFK